MKSIIRSLSVIAVCFAALLCGCGPSPEDAAENVLRNDIQSQSQGNIKLVSFTKTDGQSMNFGGVQARSIKFTAQIEIEQTGTWLIATGIGTVSYGFTTHIDNRPRDAATMLQEMEHPVIVHKGDHVIMSGEMGGRPTTDGSFKWPQAR